MPGANRQQWHTNSEKRDKRERIMATRRKFLKNSLTAGAYIGLGLPGVRLASAQDTTDEEARNKAVVRRFKESQGTDEYEQVLAEVMSPDFQRLRSGFENLATNARRVGTGGSGSTSAHGVSRSHGYDRPDDRRRGQGGHAVPRPGDARRQLLRYSGNRKDHRHYGSRRVQARGRQDRRSLVHGGRG